LLATECLMRALVDGQASEVARLAELHAEVGNDLDGWSEWLGEIAPEYAKDPGGHVMMTRVLEGASTLLARERDPDSPNSPTHQCKSVLDELSQALARRDADRGAVHSE
jgi:hypothetical protein